MGACAVEEVGSSGCQVAPEVNGISLNLQQTPILWLETFGPKVHAGLGISDTAISLYIANDVRV